MRQSQIYLGLCLLLAALFAGCTKEPVAPVKTAATKQPFNPAAARLDVFPLQWETIDYMPTPPGVPSVLVPWASGASRQFSKEIATDYKTSDGWVLLYNTFNTQRVMDNWYFVLYNKYRGLIRMYYYVPSTANYISSANIIHKLGLEGGHAPYSPMMNFADQEIVDVNVNSRFASVAERWQVARATWYAFQHELAYDANVVNQNWNSFGFTWPVRSTQITEATLNGTIEGTLKGSIKQPGTDFTISNTINAAGNGQIVIGGKSDADNLLASLGQSAVTKIKDAITGGVAGLVKNVFSGIFKTSSTEENVDVKIRAQIGLKGQLTSDFLITSPGLAIAGYDQTATPGFSPAYNQPLGVFYLTQKPSYTRVTTREFLDPSDRSSFYNTYQYAMNPIQYVINPAVTSIADVRQVSRIMISRQASGLGNEEIGGVRYYTGTDLSSEYNPLTIIGVRITLEVKPKDGSPAVLISKTFAVTGP